MATWRVQEFPDGKVAQDGSSVSVRVRLENGEEHTLEVPYQQLDWVNQALLRLANAAFDRQVQLGQLAPPPSLTDPAMTVEGFRVMAQSKGEHALVQLTGRASANSPLGMGSFVLAAQQVRGLGARLVEVAAELEQRGRPLS